MVQAHLEMIERLRAEEAMTTATAMAVGAKGLKPGAWMSRQWSAWRRAGSRSLRAAPATAGDLRAIGVGIRVVKANG